MTAERTWASRIDRIDQMLRGKKGKEVDGNRKKGGGGKENKIKEGEDEEGDE